MSDKNLPPSSSSLTTNISQSKRIIKNYSDKEEPYPLVQQPSILYNYKNGHQSSHSGVQFNILLDEHEDDGEQTAQFLLDLTPPTPVPIQTCLIRR